MRLRPLALVLLLAPAPALADEFDGKPSLSTDDKAQIDADREAEHKKIDEKLKSEGNENDRSAQQNAYKDADQQVLDKHGVSEKEYLWQNSHNSPDQQTEIKEKSKGITEKRKADAEAAATKKPEVATEPEVIRGFDDKHPLDVGPGAEKPEAPKLDADGNPVPVVEKLKPEDDPNAGQTAAPAEEAPKKHGKRSRHSNE